MPADLGRTIKKAYGVAVLIILLLSSLMGIVWGALNFSHLQRFYETDALIALAKSLTSSGKTGILYPAFLLVIMTLFLDHSSYFFIPVYILQLAIALVAWYVFAFNIKKAAKCISLASSDGIVPKKTSLERLTCALIACLAVFNPYALQCHLAVLEYSFASSFLCLLVSFYIRFSAEWKKESEGFEVNRAMIDISVISLFWLLLSLTRREFIIIGAIPPIAFSVRVIISFLKKGKSFLKKSVPHIALLISFVAIILLTDSLFYSGEKISVLDSAKRSLFYRTSPPTYFSANERIPEIFSENVSDEAVFGVMNDYGWIREDFTAELAATLGSAQTTEVLYSYAKDALVNNKKGFLKELLFDLAGYMIPPLGTENSLRGWTLSGYAVGNYDMMSGAYPVLTKYYLRLFDGLFIICFITSLLYYLKSKEIKKYKEIFAMPIIIAIICSLYYTFQGAGIWDHRKALFTTCLFLTAFFALAQNGIKNDE